MDASPLQQLLTDSSLIGTEVNVNGWLDRNETRKPEDPFAAMTEAT